MQKSLRMLQPASTPEVNFGTFFVVYTAVFPTISSVSGDCSVMLVALLTSSLWSSVDSARPVVALISRRYFVQLLSRPTNYANSSATPIVAEVSSSKVVHYHQVTNRELIEGYLQVHYTFPIPWSLVCL